MALTKVVGSGAAAQRIVDPFTKLFPFTVRVNPVPPAVAEDGLRPIMLGAPAAMVKGTGDDTPPWGLVMTMLAVPLDGTRVTPFLCTIRPDSKPEPLATSIKSGLPTAAELRLKPVLIGKGLIDSWESAPGEFHRTVDPSTNELPGTANLNGGLEAVRVNVAVAGGALAGTAVGLALTVKELVAVV